MLPNIQYPLYDTILPGTQTRVKYRPMTVREEKILLTARESDDNAIKAILQVISNCIEDKGLVLEVLPTYQIEWLFLQIRIHSISNKTEVSYRDREDEQVREFEIDLEKVRVKFESDYRSSVQISVGLDLRIEVQVPPVSAYIDAPADPDELAFHTVRHAIKSVIPADGKPINLADAPVHEQKAFVEQLNSADFAKITDFLNKVPRLHHVIEYTNAKGNARKITLSSLDDFFTL